MAFEINDKYAYYPLKTRIKKLNESTVPSFAH
jgi:hypothetical protein